MGPGVVGQVLADLLHSRQVYPEGLKMVSLDQFYVHWVPYQKLGLRSQDDIIQVGGLAGQGEALARA